MKPGLKLYQGHPVGRGPREMTQEELREAGHEPMSPLQAHRARCIDCCVGQANEVALCTAVKCPAWPFRMGANPWRQPASEERRQAARRTMTKINARRRERDGAETAGKLPEHGTAPLSTLRKWEGPTWDTAQVTESPETEPYRRDGKDDASQDCPAGMGGD
jgi:hypothetical protein